MTSKFVELFCQLEDIAKRTLDVWDVMYTFVCIDVWDVMYTFVCIDVWDVMYTFVCIDVNM